MITKAIVEECIKDSNLFRVRIPIFDGVSGGSTSTPNHLLPLATLCTLPNANNIVNVGDVVYVGFEDNDIGRPVILGHLYQQESKTTTCPDLQLRSIVVEDKKNAAASSAVLPTKTEISDISAQDISELLFYFRNLYNH